MWCGQSSTAWILGLRNYDLSHSKIFETTMERFIRKPEPGPSMPPFIALGPQNLLSRTPQERKDGGCSKLGNCVKAPKVDGRNPFRTTSETPADDSPTTTHKQWFPMVPSGAKWISSIHCIKGSESEWLRVPLSAYFREAKRSTMSIFGFPIF